MSIAPPAYQSRLTWFLTNPNQLYLNSKDFVAKHNADPTKTFKVAINHFADLKAEEKKRPGVQSACWNPDGTQEKVCALIKYCTVTCVNLFFLIETNSTITPH